MVVAPGTSIYSTLPYNKPFYLNYMNEYSQIMTTMSGTSMAAPYVSAAAARAWGYFLAAHPGAGNTDIGNTVKTGSWDSVLADDACWPHQCLV